MTALAPQNKREESSADRKSIGPLKEVSRSIWLWGNVAIFFIGLLMVCVTYIPPLLVAQGKSDFNGLADRLLQQVGAGMIGASIVGILVTRFIGGSETKLQNILGDYLKDEVTGELKTIQRNISDQSKHLLESSSALETMRQMGLSRIYTKRGEASRDVYSEIQTGLANGTITEIDLLGISLNNFVRTDSGTETFHHVWTLITGYVNGKFPYPSDRKLNIRVLVIDPLSQGAHLRSVGENRANQDQLDRLSSDLDYTTRTLALMGRRVSQQSRPGNATFAFRLYRIPPGIFLLRTNTTSYVQPYYFWKSHESKSSLPVFRLNDAEEIALHSGMKDHFDFIWESASISSSEYLEQYQLGIGKGIHQSGAINVFSTAEEGKNRILWLIRNTKKRLYIQGFSLNSYFDNQSSLYAAIRERVKKGDVEIKILLINPKSLSAIYRSYREYRLDPQANLSFDDFKDKQEYMNAKLYRETKESLYWIQQLKKLDVEEKTFHAKCYDTAPYCFMLMTDDSVLVEQYHYGNKDLYEDDGKLGNDMARFEYARVPPDLYDRRTPIQTYQLLEDHFEFVFNVCAHDVSSLVL